MDREIDTIGSIVRLMNAESNDFKELLAASGLDSEACEIVDMDLTSLDLSEQDLSGLNLQHACFENTNLTRTDLTGAKVDAFEIQFSVGLDKAKLNKDIRKEIKAARDSLVLYRPVRELELSVRTANSLFNAGFSIIGQIASVDEATLLKVPGIGRKSINELREVLNGLGYPFGYITDQMFASPRIPNEKEPNYLILNSKKTFLEISVNDDNRFRIHNLRNLRDIVGLTQAHLATAAGLSISTISRIERSHSVGGITAETLLKLSNGLGSSAASLEIDTV